MKLRARWSLTLGLSLLALTHSQVQAQPALAGNLQGAYEGRYVQLAADGSAPMRGDIYFDIDVLGRIYGQLSTYPPTTDNRPRASYVPLYGIVDPLTRRGYFRMTRYETGGPSNGVPITEKIPVFLYRDGRLVGGSVDAQGMATTFRAHFKEFYLPYDNPPYVPPDYPLPDPTDP